MAGAFLFMFCGGSLISASSDWLESLQWASSLVTHFFSGGEDVTQARLSPAAAVPPYRIHTLAARFCSDIKDRGFCHRAVVLKGEELVVDSTHCTHTEKERAREEVRHCLRNKMFFFFTIVRSLKKIRSCFVNGVAIVHCAARLVCSR